MVKIMSNTKKDAVTKTSDVVAKPKALPKRFVAVNELVRAVPSTKPGAKPNETMFETIAPGQRFAASPEELEGYPATAYTRYEAPAKVDADDIEIDEDLEEVVDIDPATGQPKVLTDTGGSHEDV